MEIDVEKRTRTFGFDFNAIKYVQVETIKLDASSPKNNITALIKESNPGSGSQKKASTSILDWRGLSHNVEEI